MSSIGQAISIECTIDNTHCAVSQQGQNYSRKKKITPNLKTSWKIEQIFNNFKKKILNSQICISKTTVILYVSFSVC